MGRTYYGNYGIMGGGSKSNHLGLKIIALILAILILIGVVGAYIINSRTYQPSLEAQRVFSTSAVKDEGDVLIFEPNGTSKGTIVFYQGGLVALKSYSPFARAMADEGYRVLLPKMPLNLAILRVNAYEKLKQAYPSEGPWYLGGHSLGGASALLYVSKDLNSVDGLFLMGAYGTDKTDLTRATFPVISIVASEDRVMDWETYEGFKALLPQQTVYITIEGGNHAGFGSYGAQDGDGVSQLSGDEQLRAIVGYLSDFFK